MKIIVNEVNQMASGGSHVTRYEADVEFTNHKWDGVLVHPPEDMEDCEELQMAMEAIADGAMDALQLLDKGAIIKVKKITLHPTDFKPRKFAYYTEQKVRELMK